MSSIGDEDIDDTIATGDARIDGLLDAFRWSKFAQGVMRFAITTSEENYEDTRDGLVEDYPDDVHEDVFAMPQDMVDGILRSGQEFARILPFSFENDQNAQNDARIRLGITSFAKAEDDDKDAPAYAYTPDEETGIFDDRNWRSGDMFFNRDVFETADPQIGTYEYHTIIHEIGHAMGLKHGHEPKEFEDGFVRAALPQQWDSMEFTVMTYRSFVGQDLRKDDGYTNRDGHYAQTLMMLDIAALQSQYGADFSTARGNSVYSWDETGGSFFINGARQWTPFADVVFMTIWDGGGTDTYDLSNYTTEMTLDLAPGGEIDFGTQLAQLEVKRGVVTQEARANVWNALLHEGNGQSLIENAIAGDGNDTIFGNTVKNRLEGGAGRDDLNGLLNNDTLIGGAGGDELFGGKGDDLLVGGRGGDLMNGGDGFDRVDYSGTDDETFVLTPFGRPKDGTWRVRGSDEAEGDLLARIEGFVFGSGRDQITLRDSPAAVSVTIDAGGGNDTIFGGDGQDDVETLIGGAGSDLIDPGAGKFQAFGGRLAKDGVTWIESLADGDTLLIDRSREGGDYLLFHQTLQGSPTGLFGDGEGSRARGFARLDYSGSDFVDNVAGGFGDDIILGGGGGDNVSAGLGDDVVNGGAGDDALSGGAGDDYLLGGSGADGLNGFEGDDVLDLGDAPAQRIEGANGGLGRDTLFGGDGQQRLEGNEGDDAVSAGAGEDQLLGGTGDDTLEGGAGKDFVTGGEGADWALYTTSDAGVAVDLTATSASGGHAQGDVLSGIENLLGSRFADTLSGGEGANVIDGGEGADVLRGRSGRDVFVFSVEPEKSAEADRIVDFVADADVIWLDRDAFADIGPIGTLGRDLLRIGAAAEDKSDRIIYDRKSGELFFDVDGKGGADQVRFAVLKSGLDLARGDFEVVG